MARVSMIVWNTFQNDARVLKEAETLAGQGYAVTVFALLQPGETPGYEVLRQNLKVVRVRRTPIRALGRLFEPFLTTKGPGKGMGLGLALAREHVERCGGTLQGGNGPEGGAHFALHLLRASRPTSRPASRVA